MVNKEVLISKDKYVEAVLSVTNCFLRLTKSEMDFLMYIWNNQLLVLDKINRKFILDNYGKDIYQTNNLIYILKKKGILVSDGNFPCISKSVVDLFNSEEFCLTLKVSE
jgi:hypothetical protein